MFAGQTIFNKFLAKLGAKFADDLLFQEAHFRSCGAGLFSQVRKIADLIFGIAHDGWHLQTSSPRRRKSTLILLRIRGAVALIFDQSLRTSAKLADQTIFNKLLAKFRAELVDHVLRHTAHFLSYGAGLFFWKYEK